MTPVLDRMLPLAAGVALLALASQAAIPARPVPVTMQTLAVTLVGAGLGARLGAATVVAWLALAAAGLPLLSDGGSGLDRFTGPSAGYLAAMPVAAFVTGHLVSRGRGPGAVVAAMAAGNLVVLAGGAGWLFWRGGWDAARGGVVPFLPGAAMKAAAGVAILLVLGGGRRGRR